MASPKIGRDRKWRSLPEHFQLRGLPGYSFPGIPNPPIVTTYLLVNQLLGNEWRSREEIAAAQFGQLRTLLGFAAKNCPFYADRMRSCGLDPAGMRSLDDFRRLPLLTRRDIQDHSDAMRARALPAGTQNVRQLSTSGSSGSPVRVQPTTASGAVWHACCVRDYIWADLDPRGTLLSLRHFADSSPAAQTADGIERSGWGEPMSHLFKTGHCFLMDVGRDPDKQLELLRRANPDYLLSYPSNLERLGSLLAERGGDISRLKKILAIGEVLPGHVREKIETLFGVPAWDTYSAVEVGYIAGLCPAGHGYHVHDENVLVEVLDEDGRPCGPGESGRVVLTGLVHYGKPLIRYDVGDYAAALDGPCPCGRGLTRLSHVVGRQRGQLVRPDGTIIFSSRLSVAIRDAGAIRQYQVIQHARDRVEVLVVPGDGFGDEQESTIAAAFEREFDAPVNVTFTRVEMIDRTPGGKYLDFICKAE